MQTQQTPDEQTKRAKAYNFATHNPPRYCGWSNQGDPKMDADALAIHRRWIATGKSKGKA